MPTSGPPSREVHRHEIDVVKGIAAIFVFLIHACPLTGTFVGDHVVNRAVPIFLVLFGLTSELWWRARSGDPWLATVRAWYRTRLLRLLVPLWGMLVLWYPAALALDEERRLSPILVVATLAGYLSWIPTGWFVTLILELVVLLPFVRLAVQATRRVGALVAAGCASALTYRYVFQVIAMLRVVFRHRSPLVGQHLFFYYGIFPPTHAWVLVSGIVLGGIDRTGWERLTRVAPLILGLGWCLPLSGIAAPDGMRYVTTMLLDPVLTVTLLAVSAALPAHAALSRMLAWCGVHSWGLYLGQMLVFSSTEMAGFTPWESEARLVRWIWFGVLFLAALVLTRAGNRVRARLPRRILGS